MSEVKNSHYVSQLLTRPWATSDGWLHYFDLATSTLGRKPARTLLAVPGLHSTATERKLQHLVEDSVGKYKKRCEKLGGQLVDFNEVDPREVRALIGLVGLQSWRAMQALRPKPLDYTLDQMFADENAFDWLISKLSAEFTLVGGSLPAGDFMYFPSVGYFSIPVMDHPPAAAVPLSLRTFVALYPREAIVESGIKAMVETQAMIASFSMLGGGLEHKIILPAAMVAHHEKDPNALIESIREQRRLGREMFNLIAKAALVAGMRGYAYDDDGHLGGTSVAT